MQTKTIKKRIIIIVIIVAVFMALLSLFFLLKTKPNQDAESTEEEIILINEANFPDLQFRTVVLERVDKDHNKILSENERNVSNLILPNITDMKGLEYFEELKTVTIGYYYGDDLDLSGFPNLNKVCIEWAENLTTLQFTSETCTILEICYCNNLVDVQVDAPNLKECTISNCRVIKSLDLSACENLTRVACSNASLLSFEFDGKIEECYMSSAIKTEVSEKVINLFELDPDIQLSQISYLHNATLDENGNLTIHADEKTGAGYTYRYGGNSLVVRFFTEGLIYNTERGDWEYYMDGQPSLFCGIAEKEDGLWYVYAGKIDYSYTGSYEENYVTYQIENGKVL